MLLPNYLANNQLNTQVVMHRLWAINPSLLLEALIEYYAQDPNNLVRILDICQELKVRARSAEHSCYLPAADHMLAGRL